MIYDDIQSHKKPGLQHLSETTPQLFNRAPNNVDKKTTEKTCRQKKCDRRIAGDNTSNLKCLLCGFNNQERPCHN